LAISRSRVIWGCSAPFYLSLLVPAFAVLIGSANPGLGIATFAIGSLLVGYLLARGRIPSLRGAASPEAVEVPPGIRAPEGRQFAVHPGPGEARVSLSVRGAPAFDLERESRGGEWRLRPGDHVKVETGDTAFDARFHLEGERIHPQAREALKVLFDEFGVTRIESKTEQLTATAPLSVLGTAARYEELLGLLVKAAVAVERIPIDVRVLGSTRTALVGAKGAARCSFCHGDITGHEPDLVACGSCSTVLHEGCWADLGHCPVLGCRGRHPERARTA
jgi:hypothetical protein